jgi:hypothetical protein
MMVEESQKNAILAQICSQYGLAPQDPEYHYLECMLEANFQTKELMSLLPEAIISALNSWVAEELYPKIDLQIKTIDTSHKINARPSKQQSFTKDVILLVAACSLMSNIIGGVLFFLASKYFNSTNSTAVPRNECIQLAQKVGLRKRNNSTPCLYYIN